MKVNKSNTQEILITYNDIIGQEQHVAIYPWSNGEGYLISFSNHTTIDVDVEAWHAMKLGIDFASDIETTN
jgi:hypothetical protein